MKSGRFYNQFTRLQVPTFEFYTGTQGPDDPSVTDRTINLRLSHRCIASQVSVWEQCLVCSERISHTTITGVNAQETGTGWIYHFMCRVPSCVERARRSYSGRLLPDKMTSYIWRWQALKRPGQIEDWKWHDIRVWF